MRPEDVIKLVNADPFTPFRIAIRDGRMFDVLNTSMIKVGRERVFLFTPHPRLADVFDHFDIVSLAYILSIEPIENKRSA